MGLSLLPEGYFLNCLVFIVLTGKLEIVLFHIYIFFNLSDIGYNAEDKGNSH